MTHTHMSPEEFKTHRETLGLTQEELAREMGFNSGRAIRAYELGERVISNMAAHFILALVKRQEFIDGATALHERYYGGKS